MAAVRTFAAPAAETPGRVRYYPFKIVHHKIPAADNVGGRPCPPEKNLSPADTSREASYIIQTAKSHIKKLARSFKTFRFKN